MNKGMIISYFNKLSKARYISSSITQMAAKVGVHRNTISNWLAIEGYYEDETCLIFCIDSQQYIRRERKKEAPKKPISHLKNEVDLPAEIVQPIRVIAQKQNHWKSREDSKPKKKWDGKLR